MNLIEYLGNLSERELEEVAREIARRLTTRRVSVLASGLAQGLNTAAASGQDSSNLLSAGDALAHATYFLQRAANTHTS